MEQRMMHHGPEHENPSSEWELLARRLRPAAVGLTRNAEDAADLVQQTVVRLMTRAPEQVGNIGYARRTLLRLWLDEQRSMRRRVRRVVARAFMCTCWHVDVDDVERRERLERIHASIDRLPPRQRMAIVLRLIEDLDYEQIAEVMACDVGNVRSLIHAARARLRREAGEMT